MQNKVVTIMERSMRELGLNRSASISAAWGRVKANYDDGYGETDDLFAVTEWVRRTRPDDQFGLAVFPSGPSLPCGRPRT